MRNGVSVRRDALRARNVDECMITGLVRSVGDVMNRLQLRLRMQKALVAPRNVVVHFNSEYVAGPRAAHDLECIAPLEAVSTNAHIVGPVLLPRIGSSHQPQSKQQKTQRANKRFFHATPLDISYQDF